MATEWESGESARLARRWQYGTSAATLPGSCPHCHHNGAFTEVRVPAQVNLGLGDASVPEGSGAGGGNRWLRADRALESVSISYPERWAVACACGDASHGDDPGCGRSGLVEMRRDQD